MKKLQVLTIASLIDIFLNKETTSKLIRMLVGTRWRVWMKWTKYEVYLIKEEDFPMKGCSVLERKLSRS